MTKTMEVVAAVGFAASILTFINLLTKLAEGAYEIHESVTGITEENTHVSNALDDLQDITDDLAADFKSGDKHERTLAKLAQQYRALFEELQAKLRSLQAEDNSKCFT